MAATTLCSHSGELEIVQLYHGHGRKELFNTLTILQSFFLYFFGRKSTTIYRLQGGKNTDRFRKPKWIWLLETLRILEKWMNLLNSMDLLNFIHPLFPTKILWHEIISRHNKRHRLLKGNIILVFLLNYFFKLKYFN